MYEGAGILDGECGYLARSSSATSKIRARSSIACAHPRACGGGHAEGEGHRTSPRSASALASCAYVIGYEAMQRAMERRARAR